MADVTVTSNDSYIIDIDNDNNASDKVFKVTHDNGTELLRIQENGNVGIGIASPGTRLDVVGATTPSWMTNATLRAGVGVTNQHGILGQTGATGYWGGVFHNSTTQAEVDLAGDHAAIFKAGNVGIRVSAPQGTLHIIEGTNWPALILENYGANWTRLQFRYNGTMKWCLNNDTEGGFCIDSASTRAIEIYQDGRTAIGGVPSPQIDGKLHVVSGHITLEQISAPTNAPSSKVRIFLRNNGGKNELCAIFPTGGVQRIAIEP